jgi:hypothetical protein
VSCERRDAPIDQAGSLPNSQSPKIGEDGAVMSHPASTQF